MAAHVEVACPEAWVTGAGGVRGVRARRGGAEGVYQMGRGVFVPGPTTPRAGAREAAALEVLGALYAHPANPPSAVAEAVTHMCLLLLAEADAVDARAARATLAQFDRPLRTARRLRVPRTLVLPARTAG